MTVWGSPDLVWSRMCVTSARSTAISMGQKLWAFLVWKAPGALNVAGLTKEVLTFMTTDIFLYMATRAYWLLLVITVNKGWLKHSLHSLNAGLIGQCVQQSWMKILAPLELFQKMHHFSQKSVAITNVLVCLFPLIALDQHKKAEEKKSQIWHHFTQNSENRQDKKDFKNTEFWYSVKLKLSYGMIL